MSSLGDFLNVMYKKRELEYEATMNQSKADVAGAQAIGKGISNIGGAIGSIGQGIGGVMQKTNTDQIATRLAAEQGVTLQGGGIMGGAATEFDLRQKMGQLGANEMTPYQKMMAQQGQDRTEIMARAEQRRYEEYLDKKGDAYGKQASKTYTDSVANADAYQNQSAANMAKLHTAETPEVFETLARHQRSLNLGAAKAGVPEKDLVQVPSEFIPMQNRASYGLYQEEQRFGQGTSNPASMSQARTAAEASQAPRYGTQAGELRPPTMSHGVNIPPGAIPAPGFPGKPGATSTMNGKKYVWDGNFFVPRE